VAGLVDPDDLGQPEPEQRGRMAPRPPDAGARRDELVANAGHELKTPLSIMLGLSGRLLAASDVAGPARRDVERIRANAYALLKHVDDLLEAARLDDGRVVLEPSDCDVAALVRETATGFASLLEERGQRLVLHTPGRVPARLDQARFGSVVTNLLANAVRYAPRGGVVRVALTAADGSLRLEVADSGPGIPAVERAAVFERFHQVAGPEHRRPGSTGLGLAIVRDLVELHGGTVTADEAPEGGALLCVELPHETAVAGPIAPPAPAALDAPERERATVEALKLELGALDRRGAGAAGHDRSGLPRVVLVEGSPTLAPYLEELLGGDYDVRRAAGAEEAVRIAAETEVDAVLVDVGGPGGEALLAGLRAPPLAGVPLVVLAGDPAQAQELVRERADDYAVKPFAETLLVRLGTLVGARRAESARAEADARFRAVFQHAPTAMALATTEGRLLEVNAALARLLGLPRDAPGELTLDDLTHPDDVLEAPARLVPPSEAGAVLRLERRLVAADGRIVPAVLTISVVHDGGAPRQLAIQIEERSGAARRTGRDATMLAQALSAQLARCVRYDERAALLLVEIGSARDDGDDGARRRTAAVVAAAMRRRLRGSDALVPVGDRRFAALLVNASAPAALAVARGVRAAVQEDAAEAGRPLSAAVGVCAFDASATVEGVVAEAEAALRTARRGRGVAVTAA
jgi:PAS domain S-box-containing protein